MRGCARHTRSGRAPGSEASALRESASWCGSKWLEPLWLVPLLAQIFGTLRSASPKKRRSQVASDMNDFSLDRTCTDRQAFDAEQNLRAAHIQRTPPMSNFQTIKKYHFGKLATIVIFTALSACLSSIPSETMSYKLHEGCTDEKSCGALVEEGRKYYQTCVSEKNRLSRRTPLEQIFVPSGPYLYEDCDKLQDQWRISMNKYMMTVIKPEVMACTNMKFPKGSSEWNQCWEVHKTVREFMNINKESNFDYKTEESFTVCNHACSYGAQAECCKFVGRVVDAAIANREKQEEEKARIIGIRYCKQSCDKNFETCIVNAQTQNGHVDHESGKACHYARQECFKACAM